jgi:hypothetical protein
MNILTVLLTPQMLFDPKMIIFHSKFQSVHIKVVFYQVAQRREVKEK